MGVGLIRQTFSCLVVIETGDQGISEGEKGRKSEFFETHQSISTRSMLISKVSMVASLSLLWALLLSIFKEIMVKYGILHVQDSLLKNVKSADLRNNLSKTQLFWRPPL